MSTPAEEHAQVLDHWRKQLQELREQNKQILLEMSAAGVQAEDASVLNARFDCLVDSIGEAMGPEAGPDFKLLAHVRWQQRLLVLLTEARKQGTKTVLGMGGLLSPSQISQLARDTGTPGWQKT
jgi:hypothetical protein